MTRDCVIIGKLLYTAMARGFLKLRAEQMKEEKAEAKTNRKPLCHDYEWIETLLAKFYGLNATGWMKSQLRDAYNYFVKPFVPTKYQGEPQSTAQQHRETQSIGGHMHVLRLLHREDFREVM